MWFYTADTATRIAAIRRPVLDRETPARPRHPRLGATLRSLADRIDPHTPTRVSRPAVP